MNEIKYINTNDKLSDSLFSFYTRNGKYDYKHTVIVEPNTSPLVPRKFIIQKKMNDNKPTDIFFIVWDELYLKPDVDSEKEGESGKIIVEIKIIGINDKTVIHKQTIDSISHHFHELEPELLKLCV